MFTKFLNKLMNRPSSEDRKFWRAVGVLIAFAAIGAVWFLFESLQ